MVVNENHPEFSAFLVDRANDHYVAIVREARYQNWKPEYGESYAHGPAERNAGPMSNYEILTYVEEEPAPEEHRHLPRLIHVRSRYDDSHR